MKKTVSHEKQVERFQKSLGDIIVLLLEVKNKPGITRSVKREVDDVCKRRSKSVPPGGRFKSVPL